MILLAFIFFHSERKELGQIIPNIENADAMWIWAGIAVTLLYVWLQSAMYVTSFSAIGLALKWIDAIELFLKRNFLSIFLPAGGVSSLAYTPSQLKKRKFNQAQIHQGSGLYGFAGLFTVFLVGMPVVIIFSFSTGQHIRSAWMGLVVVIAIILGIFLIGMELKAKGKFYKWLTRKIPSSTSLIDQLFAANVNAKKYTGTILFSSGIEFTGMFHILIAMLALGLPASFSIAAMAYIVSVLLMVVSPFLRGLGAVEFSLVYILEVYGYSTIQAISITVLYRVFEFWLPMLLGIVAFAWRGRQLFARIFPALLIFSLGIVNIISVVTPPLRTRLRLLHQFLPFEAISATNVIVLFVGLSLLITSAFMFRGLRNAWLIALILSVLSFFGNITKALDYEEAIFAAAIIILLLITRNQYRARSSTKWIRMGLLSVAAIFISVLIFGYFSFYFLPKRHFGIDFTWRQSLYYTMQIFLLGGDNSLSPHTRFAEQFIWIIKILGFASWGFLLFTIIKPFLSIEKPNISGVDRANTLILAYGNSAIDFFKTSEEKLLFFSEGYDAFVSYRVANGFAVVLGEPVCSDENKLNVIDEFYEQCKKMGLKAVFYRVDEKSLSWFELLHKKKLYIGQEAILEVGKFTLAGRDKKSLRNGLNALQKKGFTSEIHKAPLSDEFIATLKSISDEWLKVYEKEEKIFSQGLYDINEIKNQDIITVSDPSRQVVAFLNIVPDFVPAECTYDLIRKIRRAPGGCMDALIIKLIEYAEIHHFNFINLGLVPLTGISDPQNPAERIIKFAGDRMRWFRHFRGLRDFKEKYATLWENKYLIYETDYDLIQLPMILNKIMQP